MCASFVTTPAHGAVPHWDPANEFEPEDTVYTLTVYVPPRRPKWYRPFRPEIHKDFSIRPETIQPGESIGWHKLKFLKTKTVKIKSYLFPAEVRCEHLAEPEKTECKEKCYVLEEGDKDRKSGQCEKDDCLGHVYYE